MYPSEHKPRAEVEARQALLYNQRADSGYFLEDYNALTLFCRQYYINTVRGRPLYKAADFHFDSASAMYEYLESIHPAHMNAIRRIHLRLGLKRMVDGSYSLLEREALEWLRCVGPL